STWDGLRRRTQRGLSAHCRQGPIDVISEVLGRAQSMHLNRRRFIGAISAGASAAVSASHLRASDKPAAAFTLGLGTYTFRNQDMAGLIERCRDLNPRTIELSHPQFMLPQADLS